jgi:TPR repeat protein
MREGLERAKENYLVAAELGLVAAMVRLGNILNKDDHQRFVWFGGAAANGFCNSFLSEMRDQIHKLNSGIGHAKVIFVIGRALKGHIDNEKRTMFGNGYKFDTSIGPANQAHHFYNFQLHVSKSSRQLDNCWLKEQSCERYSKDD